MLQQFTWQHFLVATLVLTLIWYLAVILLFYREEFFGLITRKKIDGSDNRLPHRWEKGVDQLDVNIEEEPELMGASKLPEGMSLTTSDAFGFSGGISEDSKMEQVGLVPDVLQELKAVFAKLSQNDGNKRDFLEMMAEVREKFPKLVFNPNIGKINGFISEHAPFHLSAQELEDIWD
ncbi:hypothetical protein ACFOG5_19455 [Pedobacter fastidiosus]|uniref:Uncharacterized protein n=1 Tax=Pedobacter fastidiosus TaxID=2765361 RepID=A0ABR7KY29_9SPHI|nr:hypothetical protein [Pedobacter fastidiosus]MBC6112809.1 hypothetical protein [Pedobacter fastidiosus]